MVVKNTSRILKHVLNPKPNSWFAKALTRNSEYICLNEPDHEVELAGPLTINISVIAESTLTALSGGGTPHVHQSPIYSYDMSLSQGQLWKYRMPSIGLMPVLGAERFCVVIRPTSPQPTGPMTTPSDLPCDFAVAPLEDSAKFFPSSCEPCGSHFVRTPPSCGSSLNIPVAKGGCVRPRYFNGMFITREDMETEQRYFRMKNRLQNRAAGSGVVWGLGVGWKGNKIVVRPGYAVDCCGNDLTVTCDYTVDVALLLADPCICNRLTQEKKCFRLVLEYVECYEEPRPVHGDGCAPSLGGCEMSRVRETVRLRLAPPCEHEPTNPIREFLDNVPVVGDLMPTSPGSEITVRWESMPDGTPAPWMLTYKTKNFSSRPPYEFNPRASESVGGRVSLPGGIGGDTVTFTISANTNAPFTRATLRRTNPTPQASLPIELTNIQWEENPKRGELEYEYKFDWECGGTQVQRGTATITAKFVPVRSFDLGFVQEVDPYIAHATKIDDVPMPPSGQHVIFLDSDPPYVFHGTGWIRTIPGNNFSCEIETNNGIGGVLNRYPGDLVVVRGEDAGDLEIITTMEHQVVSSTQPPKLPCCDPSCCEEHEHFPRDLEICVLLLALVYGRAVQERERLVRLSIAAPTGTAIDSRLSSLMGQCIQRLRLFNGSRDIPALESALVNIYQAWCQAGLYPGPDCTCDCGGGCGCQGVVIGCADVRTGEICDINAMSGRQWVLHAPILQHWASQFGFETVDSRIARLFSRLCCISSLPGFGQLFGGQFATTGLNEFARVSTRTMAAVVAHGDIPLSDSSNRVVQLLADMDHVNFDELVDRVSAFFCTELPARRSTNDRNFGRVMKEFELLPRDARLVNSTREVFSRIALAVLPEISIENVVDPESPLFSPLENAGVTSVGDLLALDDSEIKVLAKDRVLAKELNRALANSESILEIATKSTAAVSRALFDADVLTVSDDLRTKPEVANRLAKDLFDKLRENNVTVAAEGVVRAVNLAKSEVNG